MTNALAYYDVEIKYIRKKFYSRDSKIFQFILLSVYSEIKSIMKYIADTKEHN